MSTLLESRMALHKPGQITWPEPKLGLKCDSCAHFRVIVPKASAPKADAPPLTDFTGMKGICALVRAHQAVGGARFVGSEAIACPKHRGASDAA